MSMSLTNWNDFVDAYRNRTDNTSSGEFYITSTRPHGKSAAVGMAVQYNLGKQTYLPRPRDVIFNAPATIVLWDDGTKTVVKLMEGEEFNPEVGLAMCFCKKVMGDGYKRWFKDALKKGRWQ